MTSNPQLLGPLGPWVVATARVLLALIFLYSGQDKLRHWQASVAEVRELGLPIPTGFAAATILTQLLASAAVAFDLSPRIGASLLAVFTVAAALLGHRFWLYHGKKAQIEVMTVLADLGLVGGLLLIVAGSC